MPERFATAVWTGTLQQGNGVVSVESGTFRDAPYSFPSRFETGPGTNPEELLGAAHAGCFAMAFANGLAKDGYDPQRVEAKATVELATDGGARIAGIVLSVVATVPDIDDATFQSLAEAAKDGCPVSGALAAPITLEARLA